MSSSLKKGKNFGVRAKSAGFTLVEMMVAVAIFSLVMMVALSAVLSMVSANKKGQAISSVINNLNFALESMNRDLRTGTGYECAGPDKENCKVISFDSLIHKAKISYIFDSTNHTIRRLKESKSSQMISDEVYIEDMNFDIANTGENDYAQPVILLNIRGCASASRKPLPDGEGGCDPTNKDISIFKLQTLLTQRKLDS